VYVEWLALLTEDYQYPVLLRMNASFGEVDDG
jgi:hypothetical protein